MSGSNTLGVGELLREFASRRLSPVEVLDAVAARIAAIDHRVGGFTALCLERARAEAIASEEAWRRGEARALEGVPFGAKDLFDSEGVPTAYGSPMFAAHVPGRDAEAVRRTRSAGAILVGKTQTHEFAWGITSVNELRGSARNPWALDRVSGGSSGGSAVVLAADEVPMTLGSDTGGSIRVPASFCGIVGLKPTFGRISAAGAWPLARSLDHPGPMARTPADAALLLEAVAGVDPDDSATADVPLGDVRAELDQGAAGLVVGVCPDLHLVSLAPDVEAVFEASVRSIEDAGARIVECGIIRRSVDGMTDEQIHGVRTALADLEAVSQDHDSPRFWELHGAFHWALLEPGASAWGQRVVEQTWFASQRYVRLFVSETIGDAMADHRELARYGEARDGESAALLLRAHLDRTELAVRRAFDGASAQAGV